MSSNQRTAADDFLFGTKIPSAKFPTPGTVVRGTIEGTPEMQQQTNMDGELQFWDDGKPRMQMVAVLQCEIAENPADFEDGLVERDSELGDEDEGQRRLYVKGELQKAMKLAIRKAKLSSVADLDGMEIVVTHTNSKKIGKAKYPTKFYEVELSKGTSKEVADAFGFGAKDADETEVVRPKKVQAVQADDDEDEAPRRSRGRESRVTRRGDEDED